MTCSIFFFTFFRAEHVTRVNSVQHGQSIFFAEVFCTKPTTESARMLLCRALKADGEVCCLVCTLYTSLLYSGDLCRRTRKLSQKKKGARKFHDRSCTYMYSTGALYTRTLHNARLLVQRELSLKPSTRA